MAIDFNTPAATSLTIRPEPAAADQAYDSGLRKPIQKATLGDNANGTFWGEDGFTFDDVLDLVNPLQHIPGVSTIYRELTGDSIAPGPKLIAGGLLGGVPGFVGSAVDALITQQSGASLGSQIVNLFEGEPAAAARTGPQIEAALAEAPPALLEPTPIEQLQALPQLAVPQLNAQPDNQQDRRDTSGAIDPYEAVLDLFESESAQVSQHLSGPSQALIMAQEMADKLKY